jgi:hypothetical protein
MRFAAGKHRGELLTVDGVGCAIATGEETPHPESVIVFRRAYCWKWPLACEELHKIKCAADRDPRVGDPLTQIGISAVPDRHLVTMAPVQQELSLDQRIDGLLGTRYVRGWTSDGKGEQGTRNLRSI